MKIAGGDSPFIIGMPLDLMNSCWAVSEHFLGAASHQKTMLGDTEDEDSNSKMDDFELILKSSPSEQNNNLAELKPLPPFTGYTGHLSINGIPGHHYHTIAAAPSPPRVEANNNSSDTANQNSMFYSTDQVVSSSTMDCPLDNIKTEAVDYNGLLLDPAIEDIAAVLGSAIADTTVQANNNNGNNDNNGTSNNNIDCGSSRDSWMELDWMEFDSCEQNSSNNNNKSMPLSDTLHEFVPVSSHFSSAQSTPPAVTISFQQVSQQKRDSLASVYSSMPLLQSRLQNGPPIKPELTYTLVPNCTKQEVTYSLVSECPSPSSSTQYLAHSPPGHVVSTSDLVRYNPVHSSRPSPELQVSFPHTTTPSKKSKNRSRSKTAAATSTVVYSEGLGKEKPVHRCNICNRGFLNKSNIKVHLRTHTGEKPFRCEVCGKAFRQKAHLIKHAQIHKRIGRE
ncbi:ichor [Macrosteles quadrilineatus]|uniref:ichor n=1 Tax=Macrosteles quadrilineatus TaxID=74068 RepID=UPI0023E22501|nr:ichor [Macrosteles quadrilineatus]XP_054271391.1 ichor [Macrosteles quadrilineatus]